jgi:VIT1/CCC1 family predicted Fe2+/Mn2+ transporter
MALLALFGLGIFLGNVSKRNMFVSGLKTTIAGLACIALSFFVERLSR